MSHSRFLTSLALATLALTSSAQDKSAAIKRIVEAYLAQNYVAGASVAILQADGKSFAAGYGWQDRDNGIKASENTVYRLGSISKTVTSVAAMQCVETKKMSMSEDCRKYAPEWPQSHPKITLQQILTHTSGIRHYAAGKQSVFHKHFSPIQALELFKKDPLLFTPGQKFSYSTHAFTLVARMVEFAAKQDFGPYVYEHISKPAGALTLKPEDRSVENKDRSQLYKIIAKPEVIEGPEVEDISWKVGGGGFESSAPDLAWFGLAVLSSKLLKQETTDLMFTDQKPPGSRWGLGWGLTASGDANHGGAQQGCKTFLYLDRKKHTVYAIMTNTLSESSPDSLFPAIRRIWEGS